LRAFTLVCLIIGSATVSSAPVAAQTQSSISAIPDNARQRSYVYQISRRKTAFFKPYVWWIKEPLDADRLPRHVRQGRGRTRDFL